MKQILILALSLISIMCNAQEVRPAQFFGDWDKYVTSHLHYPLEAKDKGMNGRVTVSFNISPNGEISNIKYVKSTAPCFTKEVEKILSNSPKWIPAKKDGQYIETTIVYSVVFNINNKYLAQR